MKSFHSTLFAVAFAVASLTFGGCKKNSTPDTPTPAPTTGTVDLEFEHKVGAADLKFDTDTYTNTAGDQFTVTKLLYYVSNIALTKTDGTKYSVPNAYHLINPSTDSVHIALKNIPLGDYKSISFLIGVDSARNVSGAQKGALDPNKNMFWSWNTGYIFFKMEGRSSQSPSNALTLHVGGFRKGQSLRTVALPMPAENLLVRADHHPEVHLQANLLKLFDGPGGRVRFGSTAGAGQAGTTPITVVMSPGTNANLLANNYASPAGGMFSVEHINAN